MNTYKYFYDLFFDKYSNINECLKNKIIVREILTLIKNRNELEDKFKLENDVNDKIDIYFSYNAINKKINNINNKITNKIIILSLNL